MKDPDAYARKLARNREYYAKNRERIIAWHRRYHQENREKRNAQSRANWHSNKEEFKRKRREAYAALPAEVRHQLYLVNKLTKTLKISAAEARRELGITSTVTRSRLPTRTEAVSTPVDASCAGT